MAKLELEKDGGNSQKQRDRGRREAKRWSDRKGRDTEAEKRGRGTEQREGRREEKEVPITAFLTLSVVLPLAGPRPHLPLPHGSPRPAPC